MIEFFKFMLKCLRYGGSYVFSSGPAGTNNHEPFETIGLIGYGVLVAAFGVFLLFVIKLDSVNWRAFLSLLASLPIMVIYFLIVFFFFI